MEHMATFIVCLSMILTTVRVGSVPAPNDIISGREFLTILMTPTNAGAQPVGSSAKTHHPKLPYHQQQQPGSFRGIRKLQHIFYEHSDHDDSVLPIEALFNSHEDMSFGSTYFYGNRRDQRQQPQVARADKGQPPSTVEFTGGTTLTAAFPQLETLQKNTDDGLDSTTPSSLELTGPPLVTTTFGVSGELSSISGEVETTTTVHSEQSKSLTGQNEVSHAITTEGSNDEQTYTTEVTHHLKSSNLRNAKSRNYIKMLDEDDQTMVATRVSNTHRTKQSAEELDQTVSTEIKGMVSKESFGVSKQTASTAPLESALSENDPNISSDAQNAPPGPTQHHYRMQRKQNTKGTLQSFVSHERKERLKSPSPASYGFLGGSSWSNVDDEYSKNKKRFTPNSELTSTAVGVRNADSVASPTEAEGITGMVRTVYSDPAKYYSEPAQFYSEPAKVYSEPAKIYGEPEKVYSLPARMYSEPAKVYSEPAKVYSEPAKVYSEPAKIYSQPSSYWQTAYPAANLTTTMKSTAASDPSPTDPSPAGVLLTSTEVPQLDDSASSGGLGHHQRQRLVFNELDKIPYDQLNAPKVDSNGDSLHSVVGKFVPKQSHTANGDEHQAASKLAEPVNRTLDDASFATTNRDEQQTPTVVQTLAPAIGSGDDSKVGYVVEGRNYRKYRVEEKTPDGFIVGEYGVLSHNDGNLRGVRYTADSDINPRLIYDALLKFLSL